MQEHVAAELAALETETEQPGPAHFTLNFLWLDKNIAVSVDQLFDQVVLVTVRVHSTFASSCQTINAVMCCIVQPTVVISPNTSQHACGQSCCLWNACWKCIDGFHGLQCGMAGPAADKEESSYRVLLLASQRCLGGAKEHTGDQAMDPRAVISLWRLFDSLMMIVIFGKNIDEMWIIGQQTVSIKCVTIIGCLEADKLFDKLELRALHAF